MFPEDFWFDPCPIYWDRETHPDGLKIDWAEAIVNISQDEGFWICGAFVNPPYSNPLPWVKKAIAEYNKGITIVLLLKHDSSTQWYRLLHEAGAYFLPITGRLKYGTRGPANFPSILAVLS